MATVDENKVVEELVVFLRNGLTDPKSRGTDATQSYNGDANNKTFTITQSGVQNIKTVTVNSVAQTFGTDYVSTYNDAASGTSITFGTAPGVGVNNVVITYHYGGTWIYPDSPRRDLGLGNFPRISITDLNHTRGRIGCHHAQAMQQVAYRFAITAYADDDYDVRNYINQVKDLIVASEVSFYYVSIVLMIGESPITTYPNDKTEMLQKTMDIECPFNFES